MRKVVGVLFAVAMLLPVGFLASRAGAATTRLWCHKETGSEKFSPPIPLSGPTAVAATGTTHLTSCVGVSGVTSGTLTYTGHSNANIDCTTGPDPAVSRSLAPK